MCKDLKHTLGDAGKQTRVQNCKPVVVKLLSVQLVANLYIYIYGCKITRLRTGLITLLETWLCPEVKPIILITIGNLCTAIYIYIFHTTNAFFLHNHIFYKTNAQLYIYKTDAYLYNAIFLCIFCFYEICVYLISKIRYSLFCIFNLQYGYLIFMQYYLSR